MRLGAVIRLIDNANQKEQAKAAPIVGENTWSKLSRDHVTYPMTRWASTVRPCSCQRRTRHRL
ncbi:hypothetical protein MBT84_38520 [Streptomyces sp. MBT84]|nr:hypothetical protein [Streptomyces sp. MBT84]